MAKSLQRTIRPETVVILFMMHNNAKNLHISLQTLTIINLCKTEGPFQNPYILGCDSVYMGYCLPVFKGNADKL